MTILQGHFAILLVVKAPDATSSSDPRDGTRGDGEAVRSRDRRQASFDDRITGRREGDGEESESLTISVHGADRPGIVKAVAGALADKGGNVVDLSTQLIGRPNGPFTS